MACHSPIAAVLVGAALALAAPCSATQAPAADAGTNLPDVSKWPTEVVVLRDGRSFSGLVRHEVDSLVEFVEVGRKPGRPMYLLVRWFPRGDVAQITRLPPDQREILTRSIAKFRNRTQITAALHEQIKLTQRRSGEYDYLYYRGPWFTFVSTAEDTLTRESIVRLEQMFAGFRTFIPPRLQPARPLRIVLLSTLDQYLDYQQRANLKIKNWAYFDRRSNEIVAGGRLATFTAQLREAERHHRMLLEQHKSLETLLRDKLASLAEQLKGSGAGEEELRQLRAAARRELDRQLEQQKLEIRQAERANQELYQQQFQVLYHEAFHAYLDNYVYDPARYEVPRWLNEGWVQVFEGGMLDAGTLRLDAPNPAALAALRQDLQRGGMLPLADVLRATAEHFLVRHDDATRGSHRTYLYSWGLAHYLTFQLQLLDTAALDRYVDTDSGPRDPVRRFEQLIGMPLERFQRQWRDSPRWSCDMSTVTIYHNPRCSKSRQTLALLRDHDVEPVVIEYLDTPPDEKTLQSLLEKLGMEPAELIRKQEHGQLNLPDTDDPAELVRRMAAYPQIIQRPIVVCGTQARLGRPPEDVLEIIS